MEIADKVAVITGAASGIGRSLAIELARRNVRAIALVDMGENIETVAAEVNDTAGRQVAQHRAGLAVGQVLPQCLLERRDRLVTPTGKPGNKNVESS